MRLKSGHLIFICLLSSSLAAVLASPSAAPTNSTPAVHPVAIDMQNVRFHASNNVTMDVQWLHGQLISKVQSKPPVFDDQHSFRLDIEDAEISLDGPSLTAVVNAAFDYSGSPLSDLSVTIVDGHLEQRGHLHKLISIPFKVKADVAANPDGRMRLHTNSVSGAGLPIGKIMPVLGLGLNDLIKSKPERGIQVVENDMVLDPGKMMPGIEMRGKLTRAAIRGDRLVQTFGKGLASKPRADARQNYLFFRSGTITFGKLTMTDADLQLIDADPKDPFDFNVARYNDQLVAGYSRNTPTHGLRTYMPDFADLSQLPGGKLPNPAINTH